VTDFKTLKTWREGHVLHVALNRPEVRNAFDEALIAELMACFKDIKRGDPARVICLRGEGETFCAGGDLAWMKRAAGWTMAQNLQDAVELFRMLQMVRDCPKPVVARVQGAALGGGAGLAAACDRVVAEENAQFAFTEVRLGIIPGAISPFVVEKIGLGHARDLFTSGRRFGASKAWAIGLVHDVAAPGQLDAALAEALKDYLTAAPLAVMDAKRLAFFVANEIALHPFDSLGPKVAARIAAKRADPEAKAGFEAFFEKKPPPWNPGAP
jgi:enoyl-CoA hydratase/carnithine racemase